LVRTYPLRPRQVIPKPALTLPDKPSIAVLPFTNLSGDPKEDYFSDGITEDIITELSRFSELFVIARNSSFTYKGRAVDVRQVGRELGVRYVLKGSIRRAGDRVRITGQLIDAATGAHRWAERYDRKLEDIFAVQPMMRVSPWSLPLLVITQRDRRSKGFHASRSLLSTVRHHVVGYSALYAQAVQRSIAAIGGMCFSFTKL
jgi:TolB-like protein